MVRAGEGSSGPGGGSPDAGNEGSGGVAEGAGGGEDISEDDIEILVAMEQTLSDEQLKTSLLEWGQTPTGTLNHHPKSLSSLPLSMPSSHGFPQKIATTCHQQSILGLPNPRHGRSLVDVEAYPLERLITITECFCTRGQDNAEDLRGGNGQKVRMHA